MKGSQIKALRKLAMKDGIFSHLIISDKHIYVTDTFLIARIPVDTEYEYVAQIPNCISDMCASSDCVIFAENGVYLFDKKANEKFFAEYEECERNISKIFDDYARKEFDASELYCNAGFLEKVIRAAKTFSDTVSVKFSSSLVAYVEACENGEIIAEFIVMGIRR